VEDEEEKWKLLRGMSVEVARLRRGEAQADRMRNEREWLLLERERLAVEREKKVKMTEEEMRAWARENRDRIFAGCEGYVSRAQFIAMARKVYFADVEAEPEPEIFVRERREKAEAMAKEEMGADDPVFARRVEELIAGLKWEEEEARKKREAESGAAQIPEWAIREAREQAKAERKAAGVDGVEPPRREDAKGETVGDQGGSRLVEVEEGLLTPPADPQTPPPCEAELRSQGHSQAGAWERGAEDKKGGEGAGVEGEAGGVEVELRAAGAGVDGVAEQGVVKADQGGSRLVKAKAGESHPWGWTGVETAGMGNGPGRLRRPPWR
jgi:hypothetical protein